MRAQGLALLGVWQERVTAHGSNQKKSLATDRALKIGGKIKWKSWEILCIHHSGASPSAGRRQAQMQAEVAKTTV